MFQSLQGGVRLHGRAGALLWGYRTAATLSAWRIAKHQGQWTLTATIARVDAFAVRQTPLLFSAPRAQGFWCWGVESIDVGGTRLVARLGPPEQ